MGKEMYLLVTAVLFDAPDFEQWKLSFKEK
jgi:hypothetical protein